MVLNLEQIQILQTAIGEYNYPKVTYDFQNNKEVIHPTMRDVEKVIRQDLTSGIIDRVKDGLSNVLYWGYASQRGRQRSRLERFRSIVTSNQLQGTSIILPNLTNTGLQTIKNLNLPEFSGISFISKLRMFLDPTKFVVLDLKLMKLAKAEPKTLFSQIKQYPTSIPCNGNNERLYQNWCDLCSKAANRYFGKDIIAVDTERGIFNLVNENKTNTAIELIINI